MNFDDKYLIGPNNGGFTCSICKGEEYGRFYQFVVPFFRTQKGQTWEHCGDNSVCKRCGVVYKSGASYYRHRSFSDASRSCGMSESIYRAVDVYTKYAKNHTTPLKKRVPLLDKLSKDWIIYNGKGEENG